MAEINEPRAETLEPRGLTEAIEKALEGVKASPLLRQILQMMLIYLSEELQEVAISLES